MAKRKKKDGALETSNEVEKSEMPETEPIIYSEEDALEQVADLAPNIKFIGRPAMPSKRVKIDGELITLPDADKQRSGFYHVAARQIIREYPNLYKKVIKKGA